MEQNQNLAKTQQSLTTSSADWTSNLTPIEKDVAKALFEQNLKSIPESELYIELVKLIAKTYQFCGQVANEEDIKIAATELVSELLKHQWILTISEIKIAFNLGYKGELGEYFGLNVKTFCVWVNAYRYSKHRSNAIIALHKSGVDINRKEPPTPEEEAVLRKEDAIKSFEYYKTTGTIIDIGNVTYRYLDALKVIAFDVEEKRKIAEAVKDRMIKEQELEKTEAKYTWQRDAISMAIEKIKDGTTPTLVAECRREALKVYFNQLISMDITMTDILEKKAPERVVIPKKQN